MGKDTALWYMLKTKPGENCGFGPCSVMRLTLGRLWCVTELWFLPNWCVYPIIVHCPWVLSASLCECQQVLRGGNWWLFACVAPVCGTWVECILWLMVEWIAHTRGQCWLQLADQSSFGNWLRWSWLVNLKCNRIVIKLRLAFCIRYRMILAGEAVLY